jgi:hypothetical protein
MFELKHIIVFGITQRLYPDAMLGAGRAPESQYRIDSMTLGYDDT